MKDFLHIATPAIIKRRCTNSKYLVAAVTINGVIPIEKKIKEYINDLELLIKIIILLFGLFVKTILKLFKISRLIINVKQGKIKAFKDPC